MTVVGIDNKSTCIVDADVAIMVSALNSYMPIFAQAWSLDTPLVVFVPDYPATPDWLFHIIDSDADVPNALAFHTEENDQIDGYILAKTILDNGGVPLYKDPTTDTVASALCHEVFEALIDSTCNAWWLAGSDSSTTGKLYAAEVCDPVQSNIVVIVGCDAVGNDVDVGLSDFVLPAWKDPQAVAPAQLNYTNTLTVPFSVDVGGYVVVLDPATGETTQVFGKEVPQWVQDAKKKSGRNNKRGKK